MDQSVIIFSSLVAGSRVGGGVSAAVLARAGFAPEHVPTVVFGRHPGLGAPGGGPVPDAVFSSALDGLLAHGAHKRANAILTGYFTSAEQVRAAAAFIHAAKAANPDILVLVDPICGDGVADGSADGLYVKRETAEAIAARLIPLADLVTPNAFELAFLTGGAITDIASAARTASRLGRPVLVTSVPDGPDRLAVMLADGEASCFAVVDRLEGVPHGTGDLLAALALVASLKGETGQVLCDHVTRTCERVIRASLAAGSHDLLLGAQESQDSVAPGQTQWVLGLDGCKSGWVGVLLDASGEAEPRLQLFPAITDALNVPENPAIIAIDIPIGFEETPSGAGRECERLVRKILKGRASSVFSSPLRAALAGNSHVEASALNKAAGNKGITIQCYGLFAKLREVDAAITPDMSGRVFETHPEAGFAVLKGAPTSHKKKTAEGRAERMALLVRNGIPAPLLEPHSFRKKDCAPDDVLDAAMCAVSARRILADEAMSLPADPPLDARGLPMRIVL